MARATHNDDDKVPPFRCLDLARLVVAAAMTVLIVAVTAYAVTVVLRPGELSLWVIGGSVSVTRSDDVSSSSSSSSSNLTPTTAMPYNASLGQALTFLLAVRAVNPSGRVRIYYNGTVAKLWARNSSGQVNSFLGFPFSDVALAPQSTVDSAVLVNTSAAVRSQLDYFQKLGDGIGSVNGSWLVLNGTLTVENYSGHNLPAVQAIYYCSPLLVGGDPDDQDRDVSCTKTPPAAARL